MRMLTLDEVGFVSGGDGDDEPMQEVVVQGKRIIDWPLRYYLSEDTGGGRFGGDDEPMEEVVVSAPRYSVWDHLTLESILKQLDRSWDETVNKWKEIWDFDFLDGDAPPSEKEPSEMSPKELLKFWQDLVKELSPLQRAALHAALLAAATNGGLSDQSIALAAMAGAIIAGDGAEAAAWHGHIIKSGGGPSADAVLKSALDKVRFGS